MPRRGLIALAVLLAFATARGGTTPPRGAGASAHPFAVRMVKLGGEATDPRVLAHVLYCRGLGFNALWIYAGQTGAWTAARAPKGPVLDAGFVRQARRWRRAGLEPWVSLNPPGDTGDAFVFSRREDEDRIVAYVELLRRRIHLRHLVVSFDDQPTELTDLEDIFAYGRSSAPAHLDLVRRLAARLPRDVDLWMCASAYCDAHLSDGTGPYSKPFLAGLSALPDRVGIVWTGPAVVSPSITRKDIESTRARLGGRRILVYDNAFSIDDDSDDGMALVLSPLRRRDPGLREVAAAYLACPMGDLGGARLSLATVADFLRDPEGYDPDASLRRAMRALAGEAGSDPEVGRAFDTQQIEWGGWVGERNYWPHDAMNPATVAARLVDPAFVSSFTWTEERYPRRIELLERLADRPFRDDLVRVMRRRLAVARGIPLTIEYLARRRAGRADARAVLDQIGSVRRSLEPYPDARHVLELFLDAAGVPLS